MNIFGAALGLLSSVVSYFAAIGTADAGVMSALRPEALPGTIIIFIIGIIVGALIVYFWRKGR